MTTVWVSPGATSFACLCEQCLECARVDGHTLFEAIHGASVRGTIAPGANLALARCGADHEIVIRRVERPPGLARPDERQLQLA